MLTRIAMVYSDTILLDFIKREQGDLPEITLRRSQMIEATGISSATLKRSLRRLKNAGVLSYRYETGVKCTYSVKQSEVVHG